MRTLFIADLHLSEHTPEITQGFVDYVAGTASGADSLYIVGDLFDAWIGDDLLDMPHPMTEVASRVAGALAILADSGTAVYLMHGNRDFLIGERFANACKARLLPDVQVFELHDIPVILMHGDSLCTRDEAYMAFRQQSRDPQWQAQMLALPLDQRLELAKSLRQQSDSANADKADEIMDVTAGEVIRVMAEYGVTTLIHGHTHRPRVHDMVVEDMPARRYVLGDWDTRHGWDIVIEEGAWTPQLRQFDITRPPQA